MKPFEGSEKENYQADFRCIVNDNKTIHDLRPCSKHQFKIEQEKTKKIQKEVKSIV